MRLAWELYRDMLLAYMPGAECQVWFPSDAGAKTPSEKEIKHYAGILWPGCNLTVYHFDDPRVIVQLETAILAYEFGVPSFGTCWGIQVGVVAAGGKVGPHAEGREMGIGRKIRVTDAGALHPMYEDKPRVFDGFVSHDDEVKEMPKGGVVLAGNDHSAIQSVEVKHRKGTFWGLQYHPEYDVHEMARLIIAREDRLIKHGFFAGHEDLVQYVEKLEGLFEQPDCKHLRWQLGIDDTILSQTVRQQEFINWLDKLVIPMAGLPPRET